MEGKEYQEITQILKDLGGVSPIKTIDTEIQYINIIGSIEGHTVLPQDNKTTKYEHVIPQLIIAEENPEIKGVLLILNTVGGDVEAGLALSEMIASMSKPSVSLVLGGGHSIGIPLAVSADYTYITRSATMTLHPIRTQGVVITSDTTFEFMKKTQERVVDFIVGHSKVKERKLREMINRTDDMSNDVGTVLFGREAVSVGLIDETGGLAEAMGKLRQLIAGNN